MEKPNCFKCVHKSNIPGNCHIRCNNTTAIVTGDQHGINHGWFLHPFNFDPVWLISCDGFSDNPNDKKEVPNNPLADLISLMGGKRF